MLVNYKPDIQPNELPHTADTNTTIAFLSERVRVPAVRRAISKQKKKLMLMANFKRIMDAPWLYHTLETQKRFYIRGDLLVDMQRLFEQGDRPISLFFSNEFKPVSEVKYFKDSKFFQISLDECIDQVQDFGFIIKMLDSLGNENLHQTALLLDDYLKALKRLDQQQQQNPIQEEKNIQMSQRYGLRPIWTYDKSLERANQILQDKIKSENVMSYAVLKGLKDCREVNVVGIRETMVRQLLGNVKQSEIERILLKQGLVFFSPAFSSVAQHKLEETMFFTEYGASMEPPLVLRQSQENIFAVNNLTVNMSLSLEYHKISEYTNQFNDYLVIIKANPNEKDSLMSQIFFQKLLGDQSSLDFRVMLSDLTYTAKSEHFLDTFYPKYQEHNKPNSQHLDQKNNNDITQVPNINCKKGELEIE